MCKENLYLFAFMTIALLSCESRSTYDTLDSSIDQTVRKILHKALETAGSADSYLSLAKLKFRKTTNLYDSTGNVEAHYEEQHRYHFRPERVIEVIWQDEKGQHQFVLHRNKVKKYRNGQPDTDFDSEQSKQNLLAAEYAACLPFRLLDDDIYLQYEGIDTLKNRTSVHVIRAQYESSDRSDLDLPDMWWHYFNTKSFVHEGYKVRHADHYSLVLNKQFVKIDEFFLPTARTSYRIDESGNPLFVRADYTYQDYHLRKASKKLE